MLKAAAIATLLSGCTAADRDQADECGAEDCEEMSGRPDAGQDPEEQDLCDNGLDDDGNGLIDDGCPCRLLEEQPCYPGDPALWGVGACESGVQVCVETEQGPAWGECEGAVLPGEEVCDGRDNDCNGAVDDLESGVSCEAAVEFSGDDCQTIECPADQPHPVGCEVMMNGSDSRGCAAPTNEGRAVFFKEGKSCNSGGVSGTLHCSAAPGEPLDFSNCPMNKIDPRYPLSPSECPD